MHRASSHGNGHFLLTALIFGAKSAGSEQHEISPMNIKPYKTTLSNNKKLMLSAAAFLQNWITTEEHVVMDGLAKSKAVQTI